ncbi:trypsin-like cysteine/serine peptidase domain-containing protein [Penicillium atrosanguineum]|nr:trypsin-like cysteine/serine peptidase domain-containing protein [Penicillium atrosanguineum]
MKTAHALGNSLYFLLMSALPVSALVGGSDASATNAPFTVAVLESTLFGNSYICAGSLIGPKTVLTTAGCVDGSSAISLKVRVGSLELATGGRLNYVTKIMKHPSYSSGTRDHDFAILHLTDPVTDIMPVAISKEATLTGAPVGLYGWGQTGKLLNENPRVLQRLETTFISAEVCEPKWSDITQVTRNMNCDAAPEKQQGSCKRDQGGPVVSESGHLVGIMGYYDYCEPQSEGRPDINNDPQSVSGWIALILSN